MIKINEEKSIVNKKKEKASNDQNFKIISKKLHALKFIALIFGIILVIFGLFITILSYAVDYLIKDLDDPQAVFMMVFFVGWILLITGLLIISSVSILSLPKTNKIPELISRYDKETTSPVKSKLVLSFPFSRLIAALFLIVMGFTDLFIITGKIGHHETPFGNVLFLGGPSYFYTVGFFPLMLGLGILIYSLIDSYRIYFACTEDKLMIYEFRKNKFFMTKLDKSEIELLKFQNNFVGSKYLWIVILMPFIIIFSLIEGSYLLFAPRLQDPTQAILLIYSGIMECFALYFLVIRQQNYLKINTKDYYYDMWFAPFSIKRKEIKNTNKEIEDILDFLYDKNKNKISKNSPENTFEQTEFMKKYGINSTRRYYLNLGVALFFVITGLLFLVLYFELGVLGNLYTMFTIKFGVIVIVRAYSEDFTDKNGFNVKYKSKEKNISIKQRFKHKFANIFTYNQTEVEVERKLKKLNVFDILFITLIMIYSTIETVQSWSISSDKNPITIIDSIITTIFVVIVYLIIFVYVCAPIDQLKLKTKNSKYYVPIGLMNRNLNIFQDIFAKQNKKALILRIIWILLVLILSIIANSLYLYINFI
ncbi:MAG: hypothetical protein ACTSPQ_13500 [Candidatus Helarchaeota archaeon]